MRKIIFSSPLCDYIDHPIPSINNIPKEYKNLAREYGSPSFTKKTVKACMPFLDAYTTGYLITMPVEVAFVINEQVEADKKSISISLHWNQIVADQPLFEKYFRLSSHNDKQVPFELRSQYRTIDAVLKLENPWHIKTPPGYSCIVTSPFNRNSPFKIIDGIVDTDTYTLPINFPMFWTQDISIKETILPKGYPIALVIPFKRDDWKMKVTSFSDVELSKKKLKLGKYIQDVYKKFFWQKKRFR